MDWQYQPFKPWFLGTICAFQGLLEFERFGTIAALTRGRRAT